MLLERGRVDCERRITHQLTIQKHKQRLQSLHDSERVVNVESKQ